MIRRLLAAAGLAVMLAACSGIAAPSQIPPAAATATAPTPGAFDKPARVEIPALDVVDEVEPVGLTPDRTMEVPPVEVVGWYELGVRPGQPGPAVLAGHVNYGGVSGSFARIGDLHNGDRVDVVDHDGDRLSFEVYRVVQFPKSQFDHQLVYGDTAGPELRLVTCSGRVVDHNYSDNTVVLARLAEAT